MANILLFAQRNNFNLAASDVISIHILWWRLIMRPCKIVYYTVYTNIIIHIM